MNKLTPFDSFTLGKEVPDQMLEETIQMLVQAPICCHCGANVNGALQTRGQPFNCPGCSKPVRCVRGLWLERVSPLDLQAPAPRGMA